MGQEDVTLKSAGQANLDTLRYRRNVYTSGKRWGISQMSDGRSGLEELPDDARLTQYGERAPMGMVSVTVSGSTSVRPRCR
jgi:hypothetical protein